jgi:immune inhibitor A
LRHTSWRWLSLVTAAGLGAALVAPAVSASAAPNGSASAAEAATRATGDDLPNPAEDKRRALRERALTEVLAGDARVVRRGASRVVNLGTTTTPRAVTAKGALRQRAQRTTQYVELGREKTDKIFVILAEFGNERHPDYPDRDTAPSIPGPARFDGPMHNAIPAPDRTQDNSTSWQANYNRRHYQDRYFGTGDAPGSGGDYESLRQYYERQSSGRYSIDGYVSPWVKVRYNEARYGRSNGFPCPGSVCSNTWELVRDGVEQWVTDQKAAGRTDAQIRNQLASFDTWDRYDFDGDGNFNEPDGYVDHFQIVHAGGDQADGDPWQGEDAIWSHRWKAFQGTGQGPANNPDGGVQIGTTGLWVADYTIQPENGGTSVFAHEYGHDLGLPDLYDTSGPPAAEENSVAWWSMMAQSRVSAPQDQSIDSRGADLGAWEKLLLGWLDYETVLPSQNRRLNLGPHEYNSRQAQAAVVVLPDKTVTTQLGAPFAGSRQWWSGQGDDLDSSMSRSVTLAAGTSTLAFQARWNIEDCGPDPCDYAYVEVNDGTGWAAVPGSITKSAEGNGIDGLQEAWTPATFDLSAYAGKTVQVRLRYLTDGAAQGQDASKPAGLFADQVTLTTGGQTLFTSGAEASPEGWTLAGFTSVAATSSTDYDNFYIASNRAYVSFDRYLRSGPYNFGWANTKPDLVEHFPYQNGLLVSYWDTSHSDNNASQHPGEGEILPVDANPRPLVRLDGGLWRPRVGAYDATFGLQRSNSFELHFNGQRNWVRGQDAVPVFRDDRSYWSQDQPTASVKVPDNGVSIRVLDQRGRSMRVRIFERP